MRWPPACRAGRGVGSQCYPLITNANYTVINEHAAVVASVAAAGGFGDGDWAGGEIKALQNTHGAMGAPVGAEQRVPAPAPLIFPPSLKRNLGLAVTPTLPRMAFPFVFPIPCPQSSSQCEPWPLAVLPACCLAVETPAWGSSQTPFPFTPLNNRAGF